jgi:hypothetical protein
MVIAESFEKFDIELMEFYQQDLAYWVSFMENHQDDEELRETAREFIIYNEWSIKKLKEMVDDCRTRY